MTEDQFKTLNSNLEYYLDRRMSITIGGLSSDDVRLLSVLAEILRNRFEAEKISMNALEDVFWLIEVVEEAARVALEMSEVVVQDYQRAKFDAIDAFLQKWREDHK